MTNPTAAARLPAGVMDVGGSHVLTALVPGDDPLALTKRRHHAVDAGAPRQALLDQLTSAAPTGAASSWTVAFPGPFDYVQARGDFAGVGKFASLAGVDLRGELAARLQVPTDHVSFLNDAVAYALGEWLARPDRPRRLVCVTLGTGVGSAWLANGEPVDAGPTVPLHGWAHLLTCAGRPLEDTVSTRAISGAYLQRTGVDANVKRIAEAARTGDAAATATLRTAMRCLGETLGPWLGRFGAQRLVVGGSMSRSWDLLEVPLAEGIHAAGVAVPALAPAALLDDAPLVGAAHWSRRPRPSRPSPSGA